MKCLSPVTIAVLAFLANGDVTAQGNPTTCRARTLDLRAACAWNPSNISEVDGFALNYFATAGSIVSRSSIPSDATCPTSAGHAVTHPKEKNMPMSMASGSGNNCDSLRSKASRYLYLHEYQQANDTIKHFIEVCYNDPNAPLQFQNFIASLGPLTTDDTSLWLEGRQWLESVLYLNTTTPEYFCKCVEAIAGTYNSPSDSTESLWWKEMNRGLAIDQWLVDHTTCDTPGLQNGIYGARASQYSDWLNDTTVPLDTFEPSMHDLGLDTLLARHFLFGVSEEKTQSIILSATASPNPVNTGTVITFGINQEAYVKINLFDILGQEITSPGYEGLFQPGNHAIPLSLQGLPGGTYYARILTAYGSVATVKLVKE